MYREGPLPKKIPLNINLNQGGLGDCLCALSAVKYIIDNMQVDVFLYVPDYCLEIAKNVLPGTTIRPFSKGKETWNPNWAARVMATTAGNPTSMATHLVTHAFQRLTDKMPTLEEMNYLQLNFKRANVNLHKFALPSNYVVLTTGFTASVREWPAQHINDVASYLVARGIVPVFLGNKQTSIGVALLENGRSADIVGRFNEEIDFSKGINLIEKTTLMEAAAIIKGAKALLGVDNGLTHLAAMCGDVPIVIGYTTVRPEHRLPIRHSVLGYNCHTVVPDDSLKCRFCQSNWEFVFNHDFRNCYYKEQKLDTEIKCTKAMAASKFIAHLETIL
jgi:hypothetical protein